MKLITREIVYTDELNDDFSGISKNTVSIEKNFKYIHSSIPWLLLEHLVHGVIMRPLGAIYCKIKFRIKFVGKDKLKEFSNCSYFAFGNHTQLPGDGYIPNMICYPKKPYFIVHPDNVSTKGTKNFMLMLGAIPLPTNISGYKNFLSAIKYRLEQNKPIIVFPEAHIWPYYTGIRPFKSTSFKYPVKFNSPVFSFTTTYSKTKKSKTPKITVYIDGPFYADKSLSDKENEHNLCKKVYNSMCKNARTNSYEFIHYRKVEYSD